MKQKTSVIQALVHDPDVLFLDEPTSGLDPNAARALKTLLAELRDGGTTVFLSTHALPVVDELADTVGLLYDGELLAEDDPEALKRELAGDSLEDAFVELTTGDGPPAVADGATDGGEPADTPVSRSTGGDSGQSVDDSSGRAVDRDPGRARDR